jgi:ribonuclease PH
MSNIEFSIHARDMLKERSIPEEWVMQTVNNPDRQETMADGTTHYIKAIPEFGGRSLRVVMNLEAIPNRVVTVFFDRRLRR